MTRRIGRIMAALLAAVAVLPAAAQVKWLSQTYDFGVFREEAGPQQGEVRLVNTGSAPTAINRVKSTCGCTVAGFTEGLIEPGDTARVWFTYNPFGRPGRFEKHIKVYTGVDNDVTSITLKGTVIGSPASLASKYPVEAGPMRLSATTLDLGKVPYGRTRHEYISGYNQSTDTLHLSWSAVPLPVSPGVSSKTVAPGDLFSMGIYFNSRDEVETGPLEYEFRLYPHEDDENEYTTITIKADVEPDTSALSEQQLRDAPALTVSPALIDLGDVKAGEKSRKISFRIDNEGKTEGRINRIFITGSRELTVKRMPQRVAPGASHEVKAELNLQEIPAGPFVREIVVTGNDPLHPSRTVKVVGIKK